MISEWFVSKDSEIWLPQNTINCTGAWIRGDMDSGLQLWSKRLYRLFPPAKYFTFRDESGAARIEIEIMDICKKVSQLLSTSNWIILTTRILLHATTYDHDDHMDEDDDCHDDDVEQSHQGLEPQAIGLGRFLPAKRCIVRSPGLWHTARYFSWATWGFTIIGSYIIVITQRWLFDDMGLYDYRFYIIMIYIHIFDDRHMWGRSRMTDR